MAPSPSNAPAPTSTPTATATASTPTPTTPTTPAPTRGITAALHDPIMRAALLAFIVASLVAIGTTYAAVHFFGGNAYEANPVMAGLWSRFGFRAVTLVKLAGALFILYNTFSHYSYLPRTTRAVTIVVAAITCLDAAIDCKALVHLAFNAH